MATLATLEGIEQKRGGIFNACMGACEMVASTVRGCLGSETDAFKDTGLDRAAAMENLKNVLEPLEFAINSSPDVYNKWKRGLSSVPQAGYLELNDGSKLWDNVGKQLLSWGFTDPKSYDVKKWFYPIQSFLVIWDDVYKNNPTLNAEERAAIAYYNWLGTYFEPRDVAGKNIYQYKLNTLKSFIAAAGFPSAIRKVEGEISRAGQAAQAAKQASAAAAAYKAAMERQEKEIAEAKAAQEKATNNIDESGNGGGSGTPAAGSSILPILGIAAAAALAFMG